MRDRDSRASLRAPPGWLRSGRPIRDAFLLRSEKPWPLFLPPFTLLKRQSCVRLDGEQHAPEFGLDALQARLVVGLEAQDDDRRGVGRAREPEAVRVLDPQPVEPDHLGRARERSALLQSLDQAVRL